MTRAVSPQQATLVAGIRAAKKTGESRQLPKVF
jgi:hypothetical protein